MPTINENLTRLVKITDDLTVKVDKIMLDVEKLRGDHERLKKDIYGNGKKGVIERVEILEELDKQDSVSRAKVIRIDETLKETRQDITNLNKKIAYFSGISAAVVFIINKVIEVIK